MYSDILVLNKQAGEAVQIKAVRPLSAEIPELSSWLHKGATVSVEAGSLESSWFMTVSLGLPLMSSQLPRGSPSKSAMLSDAASHVSDVLLLRVKTDQAYGSAVYRLVSSLAIVTHGPICGGWVELPRCDCARQPR